MIKNAEILVELLSEEIPARMQLGAAEQLKTRFCEKLEKYGLSYANAVTYVTPRRLVFSATDIPSMQADIDEEKRGPRVGAPEAAIQGFLSSVGLKSIDQLTVSKSDKGEFYIANVHVKGGKTADIIPQIIKEILNEFNWPKSMRWGSLVNTWVRPLKQIMCAFDGEFLTGDLPEYGINFANKTKGHRFLSDKEFSATNLSDYIAKCTQNKVIVDNEKRRAEIEKQVSQLANNKDLEINLDPNLLEEVTGLVEWPRAFMGTIDKEFMVLPPEVLITTMKVHQKYFAFYDKKGNISDSFVVVSNCEPSDKGAKIIVGNERVLRARLSDASFYYEKDKKVPLEQLNEKLTNTVFHADLGSIAAKVERVKALSATLAKLTGGDVAKCTRAAELMKADLMSGVVFEFPELQGIMGYYYALNQGEDKEVATAVKEHYQPKGPDDSIPQSQVSQIVALADKIDTLTGFFSVGIKPTGSKDPFALRRTALGIIRIAEQMPGLNIFDVVSSACDLYKVKDKVATIEAIREFIFDRVGVYWRGIGIRYDYLRAIISVDPLTPLNILKSRAEVLQEFMNRDDKIGQSLHAAYKRATNIVEIEEKKDKKQYNQVVDSKVLNVPEEQALHKVLNGNVASIKSLIESNHFAEAMVKTAELRPFIDDFFDKVIVNDNDQKVRENRLRLLSMIRSTLDNVVDFSKIE